MGSRHSVQEVASSPVLPDVIMTDTKQQATLASEHSSGVWPPIPNEDTQAEEEYDDYQLPQSVSVPKKEIHVIPEDSKVQYDTPTAEILAWCSLAIQESAEHSQERRTACMNCHH
jgi:hypothetical protein